MQQVEQTPSEPNAAGAGEPRPGSSPGDEPGDKPRKGEPPGGQEPRPDGDSQAPGELRPVLTPPEPDERGRASGARDADRWGDLPPHVQRHFRVQGADDLPPHYRDWIESYYRRLNRGR